MRDTAGRRSRLCYNDAWTDVGKEADIVIRKPFVFLTKKTVLYFRMIASLCSLKLMKVNKLRCHQNGVKMHQTCASYFGVSIGVTTDLYVCSLVRGIISKTRMWADARRDGRLSKCRWRPGYGQTSSKVWLASGERRRCSNEGKTRKPLNLLECPKLPNRSQPLVGQTSQYYGGHLEEILLLNNFFQLSISALVAKI